MGRRSGGSRGRKTSVAEAETHLNQMLDETGKKEELRDKILEDLSETAWRDQVKFKNQFLELLFKKFQFLRSNWQFWKQCMKKVRKMPPSKTWFKILLPKLLQWFRITFENQWQKKLNSF